MNRWRLLGILLGLALLLSACDLLFPDDGGPIALQLSPTRGIARSEASIVGEGFGAVQGTGAVTFDNVPATVLSWSDCILTVEVPVVPTPGGVPVLVEVNVAAVGGTIGRGEFIVDRGILFESERSGNYDIWVIDPSGGAPIRLTDAPVHDAWPSWSHDGTKILYVHDTELWVMAGDGSAQAKLAGGLVPVAGQAWSPDDRRVAFQVGEMSEIRVIEADGSGERSLTPAVGVHGWPTWLSGGMKVAYQADRTAVPGDLESFSDDPDIYAVNVDGTGEVRLTTHPGRDWLPLASPDGSKIAFTSDRDGPGEIFVMNADGSGQTNITNDPGVADGWPAWSPDGTRIAFQSYRDGNAEIYVMNADGSGLVRLTSNAAFDAGPSWSGDGTRIAFESNRTGDFEIYVMNADGSGQTQLTDQTGLDGYPVWTTSRWIDVRP
jgi:Tol biopolymer transport system component